MRPAGHRPGRRAGSGVTAVVLNVTVTDVESGGFLAAWPAGEAQPLVPRTSTMVAGQTVPNLVMVKVGAGGRSTCTTAVVRSV